MLDFASINQPRRTWLLVNTEWLTTLTYLHSEEQKNYLDV